MIGLLWQRDRDDESLETIVAHACRRYAERFGRWPTVAFVPEGTPAGEIVLAMDGVSYPVELRPIRQIPANHIMVAIEGHDPIAPSTAAFDSVAPPEPVPDQERSEGPALPESPLPASDEPAPVKRRSTMGWSPPAARPERGEAQERQAEQLTLWRRLKREDAIDRE